MIFAIMIHGKEEGGIVMSMQLEHSLKQTTTQVLSQQQQESLQILNMSITELQDFLQKEEIENPLIEETVIQPVAFHEHESSYIRGSWDDEKDPLEQIAGDRDTVYELIRGQILHSGLDRAEELIADYCFRNLDQNGFLPITEEEIAQTLHIPAAPVRKTLAVLKTFEPAGIFSRDLTDCLCTQAASLEDGPLLVKIIQNHLQDVAEGKISTISRALGIATAEVRYLIQELKKLNPRPLNGMGESKEQYIVPDLILSYTDGHWDIGMNDSGCDTIRLNDFYFQMMQTATDDELKSYFEQKMKRVQFIQKALEQRHNTLKSMGVYFVEHQGNYLLGRGPLQAMTMQEMSEAIGVHVSTISRAVREKYLMSPRGCVCMRDMFSIGVSNDANLSRNAVKDRLKAVISAEDKLHPYSDEALSCILKKEGIEISRRTVAKYRDEMGIPGTAGRKQN